MNNDDDKKTEEEYVGMQTLDDLEDENGEKLLIDQKPVDDIREELDVPDGKEEADLDNPLLQAETEEQQILSHAIQDIDNEG